MKLTDAMDIKGRLTIQKLSLDGQLIAEVKANNSIVNGGRDLVAKLFIGQPIKPISKFAVGTGTNPVQPSDTQLNCKVFEKKLNFEEKFAPEKASDRKPTEKNSTYQLQTVEMDNLQGEIKPRTKIIISANLEADEANENLTEAALLNENDIMYNRVVFPRIPKTKDFKLTLVWEILF